MIRIKLTNEERNLELIGSVFCEQYQTEAKFYIERSISLRPGFGTGARHLVVQYGDGYTGREGLAVAANGQREFACLIPHDWSNEKARISTGSCEEPECSVSDVGGSGTRTRKTGAVDLEDTSGESVARAGRSSVS